MTLSQMYLRLKQHPPRSVLIGFATIVILLLILTISPGGSAKLGSFVPHRSDSGGSRSSQKKHLLGKIFNSTLGVWTLLDGRLILSWLTDKYHIVREDLCHQSPRANRS